MRLKYTVDADTITDPFSNVMRGTDEFAAEMQGLLNALHDLYLHSSLLRLTIGDHAPRVKMFFVWDRHTDSMKNAELWLRKTSSSRL
jgi:hypothetical protein